MATRRTRTANKVDIPSVEDPVGKLEHMGRETVKKLQDLRTAALQAGMEIDIPENCIQKGEDSSAASDSTVQTGLQLTVFCYCGQHQATFVFVGVWCSLLLVASVACCHVMSRCSYLV